ncbi:polyprotein [Cucumis melo var. makuwa]|uniref:Polyprotein n=1 Tax=Cucumis melo var. makuwa TaxID=1194695 RepID=A0A5A7VHA8_CUCMM|nr:polyprotein [Cucumis melo var. makuwa]
MACFQVKLTLEEEIIKLQPEDPVLRKLAEEVRCRRRSDYACRNDGTFIKDRRSCIPPKKAFKDSILEQAHCSPYAMHPESTKMYKTLKAYYWCPSMRQEIAEFVAKCLICEQAKS